MVLTELVTENYDKLNKNDLKIYSYIMLNKNNFIEVNINQLAEILELSASSIVGFAKKLGLDGYSELRYIVKWSSSDYGDFDENEIEYTKNDIILTMSMMMALDLDEFYTKLLNAKRIFALSSGYTQKNAVDELKRNFLTVDKMIITIDKFTPHTIVNSMDSDDILFVYSLSGENKDILDFIQSIQKKPIIASITKLSNNKLSQIADYSIPFVTHEVFEYESRTKISPISQFYVVNDFLILKYISFLENHSKKY